MSPRRLLPSLTQWIWLLILLVLITQPWRTIMVASDGDTCMHWRVGEWMLANHQLITTDQFSFTRAGAPIISKEWLAEIIFALAGRLAGLFGIAAVAAIVIATTFALLHRQLLRAGNDLIAATGLTLLAAWAANMHWLARPHVFTFLLALLWHDAVRRSQWRLLPVLMLFWVNLHGAFLAGFIILGAYWLGAVLERDWVKLRAMTLTGLLSAVATLVNPSGYRLLWHNVQFLRSDFLTGWLAEYSSTNFHSAGALGFLLWLALIFLTLVILRPKLTAGEGLVLISWTYFALVAARNIPLLAILSAPILAPALAACVRGRLRDLSQRLNALASQNCAWPVVLVVAGALLWWLPKTTEMPAENWPVEATQYIHEHPADFTGRLFNQYSWGGYLLWYLPEHKTFVDGRTDFYGEDLIREFQQVTSLSTNWPAPLEKYQVQTILMPADHNLNVALALLPTQWSCVHSDSTARVWRKLE